MPTNAPTQNDLQEQLYLNVANSPLGGGVFGKGNSYWNAQYTSQIQDQALQTELANRQRSELAKQQILALFNQQGIGLDKQAKDLGNWYNRAIGTKYTDTEEAQSVLNQAQMQQQEANKSINNAFSRNGGTMEAQIAAKAATNKNFTDLMRQLAGQGTQYKRDIENRYQTLQSALTGQQMNLAGAKAGAIGTAAAQENASADMLNQRLSELYMAKIQGAQNASQNTQQGIMNLISLFAV